MDSRTLKKGEIIDVEIENIAFGGQGVARYRIDERNFTIFVDHVVPGDRVKIRIGSRKRNYAIGYIESFIEKAPVRIKPRCRHFGLEGDLCGGCSMQNLSYEEQLKIKEQQVRDSMMRLGGFDGASVMPIIGCEDPWFYRNKMEFSFTRDKKGVPGVGLHIKRMHHDVVAVRECFLMNEYVGDFVAYIRDYFTGRPSDFDFLRSLIIREGKNTGEIMVNLLTENATAGFDNNGFLQCVRQFNNEYFQKLLNSIYYTNQINIPGKPKKIEEKLLWGEKVIREKMIIKTGAGSSELEFDISPQSFFQPNTIQAQKLFALAIDAAELNGSQIVFDLYCGAGTIGLAAARFAARVYGVELNESAVLNAKENALRNNISNAEFVAGDVLKIIKDVQSNPDVVFIDPPRNGLGSGVVDAISEFKPSCIVYVSCNPTTLARDLKIFATSGYEVIGVQPVDMFPHTYHIENVATLAHI